MAQSVCRHLDAVEAKADQADLQKEQRLLSEGRGYPTQVYDIGYAGIMYLRLNYGINDQQAARGMAALATHYFCPQHSWEIPPR
jgi:hypothetical protein